MLWAVVVMIGIMGMRDSHPSFSSMAVRKLVCVKVYGLLGHHWYYACFTELHKTRTADALCPEDDDDSTVIMLDLIHFVFYWLLSLKKRRMNDDIKRSCTVSSANYTSKSHYVFAKQSIKKRLKISGCVYCYCFPWCFVLPLGALKN